MGVLPFSVEKGRGLGRSGESQDPEERGRGSWDWVLQSK